MTKAVREAERRVKELTASRASAADAYDAGYRAGRDGANMENCHFRYFANPELTKAWELGQRIANAEREHERASRKRSVR